MILQALNEYYERKSGSGEVAPPGYQWKEIPFLILLSESGHFLQLDDTRSPQGKKLVATAFLVPQERERSGSKSFEIANTLWDHYGYVLGHPKSATDKDVVMAGRQAAAFLDRCRKIALVVQHDVGINAVIAFLEDPSERALVFADPRWAECARIPGSNLSFRIAGRKELVCQEQAVRTFLELDPQDGDDDSEEALPPTEGVCLITGKYGPLARKHPRTPLLGVSPSSKSNAKLVSFQKDSGFDSYGKRQSYNAPVCEEAAFAYTTALNHLLRKGSPQRLQVGDASTVFWAADKSQFEDEFAALFGSIDADDPDRNTQAVRNLLTAVNTGVYLADDKDTRFCVLGLAPNAARIAVRFWQTGPVRQFAENIAQHFRDIAIDKPAYESGFLSLFRLLNSIALQSKAENVPPDLAGDTMRAILSDRPYPAMLLQAAVRRIRAEQEVGYIRAAIAKAHLNRLIRHDQLNTKELSMSLDKSNNDPGYRLGRLFAALERIQAAAQPGINATIRDRYYGAASSSPTTVFPVLLKLKNHHLSKLDNAGLAAWFEKMLGEIFEGIKTFPAHLSLTEQGLFAVGYYHQQQDFFKGKGQQDPERSSNDNGNGEQ